ncbi:hypothetical protein HBI11_165270 [Parastagonospora nodorum]|nr:hypothetical protein HBI11_165270 [Parastagonospora nodorum]
MFVLYQSGTTTVRVASLIQFGAKKTLYYTSTELHRRQKEMNHFASETGSFDYLNMNCECLSKHPSPGNGKIRARPAPTT